MAILLTTMVSSTQSLTTTNSIITNTSRAMSSSTIATVCIRMLAPDLKQEPLNHKAVPLEDIIPIVGIQHPYDEVDHDYVDMTPEEIAEEQDRRDQEYAEKEAAGTLTHWEIRNKQAPSWPHYVNRTKCIETITKHFIRPTLYAVEAEGGTGPTIPCRNGLGTALWTAYSKHRPLVLSPTDLWLAITQSTAKHIDKHAEEYRHLFVKHEGKERLDAVIGPGQWADGVRQLVDLMGNHTKQDVSQVFVADFKSTTAIAQVASRIVLLDTMKNYFEYGVSVVCGIPSVELVGPREDWVRLIEKTTALMDLLAPQVGIFDWKPLGEIMARIVQGPGKALRVYGDGVLGVLQRFLDTFDDSASGAILGMGYTRWWSNVIVANHISGGCSASTVYNGWWLKLFMYNSKDDILGEQVDGPDNLPSSISQVPFDFEGSPCQLLAGHFGIRERSDGAVHPVIGWAVRSAPQ